MEGPAPLVSIGKEKICEKEDGPCIGSDKALTIFIPGEQAPYSGLFHEPGTQVGRPG